MVMTQQARRRRAAAEKATKLRSPNFCVSPTRLSMRNLPFSLSEAELKQLLLAAVCPQSKIFKSITFDPILEFKFGGSSRV